MVAGTAMLSSLTFLTKTILVVPFVLQHAWAVKYSLDKDYTGNNFFTGFSFFDNATDAGGNQGFVHWVNQNVATQFHMAYVDTNNHVILMADNTTNGTGDPNFGRNSLYLMSNDNMKIGSLLIFDANHMPVGCSVWPSLFTRGTTDNTLWPTGGEIDIIENVNLATLNRYALHTALNCTLPQSTNQSGSFISEDCKATIVDQVNVINPSGCLVGETKNNSFGTGFAANGGGVYAMEWTQDGISLWFFPRGQIPTDISANNNNPDPSLWGVPSAFYPSSSCDASQAFADQQIVLDIDICGKFAGSDAVFAQTCSGKFTQCADVTRDPANYIDAYWDITYFKTFTLSSSNGNGSATTGTGTPSGTSGSQASETTSSAIGLAPSSIISTSTILTIFAMIFTLFL